MTIRVHAYGLTGFGNVLVETLQQLPDVKLTHVYTREPYHRFGYYDCQELTDLCAQTDLPCTPIGNTGPWSCEDADLAIISSFHRIFKAEHLAQYDNVLNIHPSLLPENKGATPTNWMVLSGKAVAGISAHFVDSGIDTGPVIAQHKLIHPFLPDNELRRALAWSSASLIQTIIAQYPNWEIIEATGGSWQPARSDNDAIIDENEIESAEQLANHIRAFTNYPMPRLRTKKGRTFVIDYARPQESYEVSIHGEQLLVLGYFE